MLEINGISKATKKNRGAPRKWKTLTDIPIGSTEAHEHKLGYILYKTFNNPTDVIGIWLLVKGEMVLGVRSSTLRDIVNPPKNWAAEVIKAYTKQKGIEPNPSNPPQTAPSGL